MDTSKNETDPKNEQERQRSDDKSPVDLSSASRQQQPGADSDDDRKDEPLKDRHGSPINVRPKGMDA